MESWIKALKNDKREIFRAAADAQKIADLALGYHPDYAATMKLEAETTGIDTLPRPGGVPAAGTARLKEGAMILQQSFIHHGRSFVIEAEDWPDEESAMAAFIDLQSWALQVDPAAAADLHGAFEQEREALFSETSYDRDRAPLPAVRNAQRRAVQTGLQGRAAGEPQPTVTIEARQTDEG